MDEKIFDADEMTLHEFDSSWNVDHLLRLEGVFFLKDIVGVLDIDPLRVKREAKRLLASGKPIWESMGVKKVWNHWLVRMSVFAPYYRRNLVSRVRKIPMNWDGNRLLGEKGLFLLNQVCTRIPFSTHQLRYQANLNQNAREEFGVWKDAELNMYVVDMERFSVWVQSLWKS